MGSTSRSKKDLLGLFTVWPHFLFIIMLLFVVFILPQAGVDQANEPTIFLIFASLALVTILSVFILIGIYLVCLFRNNLIPIGLKLLWAVLILFFHILSMPIFYYLYIWKPALAPVSPELPTGGN